MPDRSIVEAGARAFGLDPDELTPLSRGIHIIGSLYQHRVRGVERLLKEEVPEVKEVVAV